MFLVDALLAWHGCRASRKSVRCIYIYIYIYIYILREYYALVYFESSCRVLM
ncbi:MAG: hypothetical protein MCS20_02320 [Candidatus Phytoplasma mali]|nr:hypothetical protein [Candidatus Phytoplasma australiense]MCG7202219.1 hypothetical protein [Candidatus Phytoplasma mali]MCZ8633087.1 hypothetical protein [Spiroplasma sp. Tabriz.8]